MAELDMAREFIGQWYSVGLLRGRFGVISSARWFAAAVSGEGAWEWWWEYLMSGRWASEPLEEFDTGE
jgi:hypothetical protein